MSPRCEEHGQPFALDTTPPTAMISTAAKLARSTTSLRNAATASKIHGNAVADGYKIHASNPCMQIDP
jgi:hypothetical protein